MSFFGEIISTIFERRYQKDPLKDPDARSIPQLAEALLGSIGEVSGVTLARSILDRYARMARDEKIEFFEYLADDLEIDPDTVSATLAAYSKTPNKQTYHAFVEARALSDKLDGQAANP